MKIGKMTVRKKLTFAIAAIIVMLLLEITGFPVSEGTLDRITNTGLVYLTTQGLADLAKYFGLSLMPKVGDNEG